MRQYSSSAVQSSVELGRGLAILFTSNKYLWCKPVATADIGKGSIETDGVSAELVNDIETPRAQ